MTEIVEQPSSNRSSSDGEKDTVEINLKTIGPAPPTLLRVPSSIKDKRFDEDVYLPFTDGDSLIVAVKPKPPAKHLRDGLDIDDDDLKFQLPASTSRWKRRLYFFLHDKLKLPDILLMAIFSLSTKVWAAIILWFILAPIAHRWDLGPLFIIGTGFCIILMNLGQRQPGDVSAYSIFNEDFRELPGTLNADRIDRDIRAGQF
ncbi:uncharacterized protein LOC120017077 isoform X2 [Tripterygium wilfordii]|uniref:uncharacterized protein LOC120017077 isoform X2 n=1 Tax=Tripterygium wilfordii TaxID=458696 RepID=UPI0018F83BD2|nr:uncharacterized protein LOC120017077 isoform X2 [Tripterygium wilfordii]